RYRIPGNLLLAIGFQEAGLSRGGQVTVWPWSVNAAGDGRMFDTRQAAQDWVRAQLKAGTGSIDVGCMQVNLRWHPEAFATLDAAFDPVRNVDYAARFLRDLYRRTGDWMTAAGSYHSFSTEERNRYLAALDQNLKVANARAARAPDVQLAATAPDAADLPEPIAAPRPPQPKIGWSAALSAGQDPRRLSIYSTQGLQPVLPNFIQEF
ncbi:lytic transglycosylase domain-containing protein, partial [Thioclava sp. BHET1]